ncbi:MAG: hypothetical protein ACRERD_14075 [Candidatus Binatia bacterium]
MGLIARHAEAAGIPTLCMTSALDVTRAVNPPRAAFLDYPLGHTTGKPHQPELQHQILVQAFAAFTSLTVPGSISMLPFRWSEDDDWKRTAMMEGDTRVPRYDTPQYQNEEDRRRAQENNPETCPACEMSP